MLSRTRPVHAKLPTLCPVHPRTFSPGVLSRLSMSFMFKVLSRSTPLSRSLSVLYAVSIVLQSPEDIVGIDNLPRCRPHSSACLCFFLC